MMTPENFVRDGMEKIRAAVAAAPSHEEVFAAFEAMLTHLAPADPEIVRAEMVKAQAEMKEAMANRSDPNAPKNKSGKSAANDPNPPTDAA